MTQHSRRWYALGFTLMLPVLVMCLLSLPDFINDRAHYRVADWPLIAVVCVLFAVGLFMVYPDLWADERRNS